MSLPRTTISHISPIRFGGIPMRTLQNVHHSNTSEDSNHSISVENTEQFFQLSVKRFKNNNLPDEDPVESRAASKGIKMPDFSKSVELLNVRAENAKLCVNVTALSKELTEMKSKHFQEREQLMKEKQELEKSYTLLQRRIEELTNIEQKLNDELSVLKTATQTDSLRLLKEISELKRKVESETLERDEIRHKYRAEIDALNASAFRKKGVIGENSLKIDQLSTELNLYKTRNAELIKKLAINTEMMLDSKRTCREQQISIRQWREENQLATTIRFDVDDLKKLKEENTTLKDTLIKYKSLCENTAVLKEEKRFLEEEIVQLKKSSQKYIAENNELKISLSSNRSVGTEDNDPGFETHRRSLNEIDCLSDRCVFLNEQLNNKCLELESANEELIRQQNLITTLSGPPAASCSTTNSAECQTDFPPVEETCKNYVAELKEKDEQIDCLLQRLGDKLDYDPSATDIVRLKQNNPLDMAHDGRRNEIERLRNENMTFKLRVEELEKLRSRVSDESEALSSDVGSSNDITTNVQQKLEDAKKDEIIEKLKSGIAKLTEQRDRVAETYKQKSAQYREISSYLMGYEIKMAEGSHVIVKSLYEQTSDPGTERNFVIQSTPDGEYRLLSNNYANEWKDDFVEMYLQNDNSFPAFFAAVTLQLYQKDRSTVG